MITLQTALDTYYTFSGKLSDAVRQFSVAGVAAVWVFRVGGENAGGVAWNPSLLWPLAFFVTALSLDLLQYAYYSLVYMVLSRGAEQQIREAKKAGAVVPDRFRLSPRIHWLGNGFFLGKTIAAMCGYGFLMSFIFRQIAAT